MSCSEKIRTKKILKKLKVRSFITWLEVIKNMFRFDSFFFKYKLPSLLSIINIIFIKSLNYLNKQSTYNEITIN